MRVCDLRQKEVINIPDCQRLGYVCDIEFDLVTCCIECLIVAGPCKIWGFIGREHEYVIEMSCVCNIGEDVILVKIDPDECLKKCM